jgi:hypothetical protein
MESYDSKSERSIIKSMEIKEHRNAMIGKDWQKLNESISVMMNIF